MPALNYQVHFRTYKIFMYFLSALLEDFNLNTKVIYRAPIPFEKRQRAKPILLLLR